MKVLILLLISTLSYAGGFQNFTDSKGQIDTLILENTIRDIDRKSGKADTLDGQHGSYYAGYSSGTYTLAYVSDTNLTGTLVSQSTYYTVVGNLCTARFVITGLTVSAANTFTALVLDPTGLPGLPNVVISEIGFAAVAGASYVMASIVDNSGATDHIYIAWQGQANEAVDLYGYFIYMIP